MSLRLLVFNVRIHPAGGLKRDLVCILSGVAVET